ncbi:LysR family transcriptional regulator [Paenibacillus sp. J31TS4]|uniref:LysR family transcriptional regulator n=1 Tax=Paenibacillus sp. J31TS4 TaxID=2807195 RepID=UPI001B1515A5|nr:LysR family transcriptional regulator [Paenibacillus sp. J31TS4]GIP38282.1 LysR family transcriptional regulator [Paenibacillus sp. J31TS4]
MELLQLRYFKTVARLEHMTKAAEELRIAQPALSRTIARLEEDLGVPLFDRQKRQIRLNQYGRIFLKQAETALQALEEGRRELQDRAGLQRGRIAIATNSLQRLSPALGEFRALHPDTSFRILQLAPGETDTMVPLLESGEVDLCFTAAALAHDRIVERPVMSSQVALAVPPGHWLEGRRSVRLDEVAGEPFIEYRAGHPFRRLNEEIIRTAGIARTVVCEVEEPGALGSLVLAGLGVALVPTCRADDVPPFPVLPLDPPGLTRTFNIAYLENRYLSRAAAAFSCFLEAHFAQLEGGGSPESQAL